MLPSGLAWSIVSAYRVDTIPSAYKPLFYLYGYGLGFLLFAYFLVQRLTVKIRIDGLEHIDPETNYIFCQWHTTVPLAFQWAMPRLPRAFTARPHAWMQHPLCYMKPIHVFLRLIGVRKIVLGSTGHDGRQAADELVGYLQAGFSTWLLPDGPAGPPHVVKRGILHISAQSEVPIIPLQFEASRSIRTRSWDRKQFPFPFSTIQVRIRAPIYVSESTLERAEEELYSGLGRGEKR
jgi:lysophospholipid acyltransferase (LPLAT)-like uncharacterized protein